MPIKHGGQRPGSGRPSLKSVYNEPIVRSSVRVPESLHAFIEQYGEKGDFSDGVRKLAEMFMDASKSTIMEPKPEYTIEGNLVLKVDVPIELPEGLLAQLAARAKAEGIGISALVQRILFEATEKAA